MNTADCLHRLDELLPDDGGLVKKSAEALGPKNSLRAKDSFVKHGQALEFLGGKRGKLGRRRLIQAQKYMHPRYQVNAISEILYIKLIVCFSIDNFNTNKVYTETKIH